MHEEKYRVLILDDDYELGEMLREYLQNTNICSVTYVTCESDFWECLSKETFEILFLDYKLPGTTGLDILGRMGQAGINLPTVMMTGEGNENIAARAIQSGALDYLVKGEYSLTILPSLVQKAARLHEMQLAMQRYLEQIRYQATLLDNMRDAMVVWGLDGQIKYWNGAAEELYGLSAIEQMGYNVDEVYFPHFVPLEEPIEWKKIKNHQGECSFIRPDGKAIWISAHFSTLYSDNNEGTPIGYMNVARDITRQKQAEEKLLKSEERYRAIVEDHQTEMICRFLPDLTLTFVNEEYCRYYRFERELLVGTSFLRNVLETEREAIQETILGLTGAVPVNILEMRARLGNGEIRWQEWVCRAILENNQLVEFQAVGRDITDRKVMEEKLKLAQNHLAQAARLSSIGELASGVAHQISNPLTTIIADAQLLAHQLGQSHPGRESAEAILQAGWRAQEVINELMKFSQPSLANNQEVSINETIEKALLLASALIQASGARLVLDLQPDLPVIYANVRQITDLWVSLLLLARSSIREDNESYIRIRSASDNAGNVFVEVSDNGAPIPKEQCDTIFEPQLIPTGSGRGTGMELSLCREIVRQNRGQITFECNESETSFRIQFSLEGLN